MEVVKKLCVAGEHAATGRTGDNSLLSVTPQVLSQTILDLEEGVTAYEAKTKKTADIKVSQPYYAKGDEAGHINSLHLPRSFRLFLLVLPLQWQKRACCICESGCWSMH